MSQWWQRRRLHKITFSFFVTNLININPLSSSILCINVVQEDLDFKVSIYIIFSKGRGLYQQHLYIQRFEVFPADLENVEHGLRLHGKINVGWNPILTQAPYLATLLAAILSHFCHLKVRFYYHLEFSYFHWRETANLEKANYLPYLTCTSVLYEFYHLPLPVIVVFQ